MGSISRPLLKSAVVKTYPIPGIAPPGRARDEAGLAIAGAELGIADFFDAPAHFVRPA
jgi:hypothetical protein